MTKISDDEKSFFENNGYLIIRDTLSDLEATAVQNWVNEVRNWPITEDASFMPYSEINADGQLVLSRTENFVDSHPGLNSLLRGEKRLDILHELSGEDMVLFKEKINYKLAGSGGLV